jgi:hypothetical protein
MRLFCLFVMASLSILSEFAQSTNQFLENYFNNQKYEILKIGIQTKMKAELFLATGVETGKENIVKKALVYSDFNKEKKMYLQIVGPIVIDGAGISISDVSGVSGGFWGWKLSILKGTTNNPAVGISLECRSGPTGERTTDHPSIVWDPSKGVFFLDKVDRSQY